MQMQVLLGLTAGISGSENDLGAKVSKEILATMARIASECGRSLDNTAKIQLEILACLSAREDLPELCSEAREALRRLLETSESLSRGDARTTVASESQEKIFDLCSWLQRLRSQRQSVGLYEREALEARLARLHGQLVILQETEAAR